MSFSRKNLLLASVSGLVVTMALANVAHAAAGDGVSLSTTTGLLNGNENAGTTFVSPTFTVGGAQTGTGGAAGVTITGNGTTPATVTASITAAVTGNVAGAGILVNTSAGTQNITLTNTATGGAASQGASIAPPALRPLA